MSYCFRSISTPPNFVPSFLFRNNLLSPNGAGYIVLGAGPSPEYGPSSKGHTEKVNWSSFLKKPSTVNSSSQQWGYMTLWLFSMLEGCLVWSWPRQPQLLWVHSGAQQSCPIRRHHVHPIVLMLWLLKPFHFLFLKQSGAWQGGIQTSQLWLSPPEILILITEDFSDEPREELLRDRDLDGRLGYVQKKNQ